MSDEQNLLIIRLNHRGKPSVCIVPQVTIMLVLIRVRGWLYLNPTTHFIFYC